MTLQPIMSPNLSTFDGIKSKVKVLHGGAAAKRLKDPELLRRVRRTR